MFRSRTEVLAERAEVEGRFDDAARLYAEGGARGEAFRVLLRAAESSKSHLERRGYLTRAYGFARTDELRALAKRALGELTVSEAEGRAPRSHEERARLAEAARDLEAGGAHREAAAAYRLLGDREAVERALMLAGDVEGVEREAGADADRERYRLRRRGALESFEALWRSGERVGALGALDAWLGEHPEDTEARLLRDERRARLVRGACLEARLDGQALVVLARATVTFGREGDVVVRGASVSREHCAVERGADGTWLVRDLGSRNGTQYQGVTVAGALPLAPGCSITLGADLSLAVRSVGLGRAVLEIERGMDRGRRIELIDGTWATPLGPVRLADVGATLQPTAAVHLFGQRVVAAIALARGDRIEADGVVLEVLR